jgi:gliding motility-associated-like protein
LRYFTFILLFISASVCAQTITRVEYYFDSDPGFGNGVSIPLTVAADITLNFSVPLNIISEGFHLHYIRTKSNNGLWSLPASRPVLVQRNSQTASLFSIDRVEYFFDTDPGYGNGIAMPITAAVDLTNNFQLPLSTIAEGFHTIYYRAKSTNGLWSTLLAQPVFVQRNAQSASAASLKRIEYFFDSDPGQGNGILVSATSSLFDQSLIADLSSTSAGFHIIFFRAEDVNGRWSQPVAKPFFVGKSGSNIVALEYYYTDGTTQSPIRVYNSFTPGKDLTLDFAAVLDGLAPNTTYQIHVTAINADGQRSDETIHTFVTPAIICDPLSTPTTTGASHCGNGSVVLTAAGATGTQTYVWYQAPTGGIAIAGETDGTYTTPILNDTTTYYVAIQNGTCESARTPVTAFINLVPAQPITVNNSSCGSSSVTLSASGGINGQYRWYTTAAGGTALAGETNDLYTTPSISISTTYYVSINDGVCESTRTPVTATINSIPFKPILTSNIPLVGNALTICSSTLLTLRAPNGFVTYSWSNGETTQEITIGASGSYSLIVTDSEGCSSPVSDLITITVIPAPCNNQPPVISTLLATTVIGGVATINLLDLISDADDNIVASSLAVTQQPASGASATLVSGVLEIDYMGINFAGRDQVTIQVCDAFECTQQVLEIDVIGDIEIYNGISPNGDKRNDAFIIRYIDLFPETQKNKVTIFNRWGSKVFEVVDYNNTTNVFKGLSDSGNELPSGTYFYRIEFDLKDDRKPINGYLILKK